MYHGRLAGRPLDSRLDGLGHVEDELIFEVGVYGAFAAIIQDLATPELLLVVCILGEQSVGVPKHVLNGGDLGVSNGIRNYPNSRICPNSFQEYVQVHSSPTPCLLGVLY